MNADPQGALGRVRDACADDTYRQLTGLMDAVFGARTAGRPEHVIYDST